MIQDQLYKQKTIYKLIQTTQTQDNAVLLQTTVMVRCGSLKTKRLMKTTYFKFIAQKTFEGKTILVAVIPDDMLGKDLPSIYEGQAFLMPATIYTGTYPQIKINTDTIVDKTEEFKGLGIAGIITEAEWYIKNDIKEDVLGISLER